MDERHKDSSAVSPSLSLNSSGTSAVTTDPPVQYEPVRANLAVVLGSSNPSEPQVKSRCGVSELGESSPQAPLAVVVEEANPLEQSGQFQCSIPGGSGLADCVMVPGQQPSKSLVDPVILPSQSKGGKGASTLLKLTEMEQESQCGDIVVPVAHFITEEEEELHNPTVYPIYRTTDSGCRTDVRFADFEM